MKKGFTLLEILLVIAAIGILAAIVIVAINPNRQLAQTRDAQRRSDTNTLQKALEQYLIETGNYPSGVSENILEVCNSGSNSIGEGSVNSGCVDLRVLVPTYLAAIPLDPSTTNSETGYYVWRNSLNEKIAVSNTSGEVTEYIGINTEGSVVLNNLSGALDLSDPSSYPGSGTTLTDTSGAGLNATISNATFAGTAPLNYLAMNGINSAINFGRPPVLYNAIDTEFTAQFTIRPTNIPTTDRTIFRIDDWSRVYFVMNNTRVFFRVGYGSPSDDLNYEVALPENEWVTLTIVWDKLNRQELYIDGDLVASRTPGVVTYSGIGGNESGQANIGWGHSSPFQTPLAMDFAQFSFYQRALSPAEVYQNYYTFKQKYGL